MPHIYLILHDPMRDAASVLAPIAGSKIFKSSRIDIESLGGSKVRHSVETALILRIGIDGIPRAENNGRDYHICFREGTEMLADPVNRFAESIGETTIFIVFTFSADDIHQMDVGSDASDAYFLDFLQVKLTASSAETLLVLQLERSRSGLWSYFVGIAGMGIKNLDRAVKPDDCPFGEHTVVVYAFPALDVPVKGDLELFRSDSDRVREGFHFGDILPWNDVCKQEGSFAGADSGDCHLVLSHDNLLYYRRIFGGKIAVDVLCHPDLLFPWNSLRMGRNANHGQKSSRGQQSYSVKFHITQLHA